jgi:uncharacterized protein with von Willebrand factor type A (vWA) domain
MHTVRPSLPKAASWPVDNLGQFAGLLRDHGFTVGVAEQQSMLEAAMHLGATRAEDISAAWRSIACCHVREWRQWPELFDRFWFPHRIKGTVRVSGQTRPSRSLREQVQAMHADMDAASQPQNNAAPRSSDVSDHAALQDSEAQSRAQGGATRTEALHDRELSQWLPQDLGALRQLAERIAQQLRKRLTRRQQWHQQGSRLDVRKTLRASVAHGGLPIKPVWKQPRRIQPKLFILVDVSRSMESHAQLFLRMARAFVQATPTRAFVFHTRLSEITSLLERDSGRVQEKINAVTAGFGGGTRIATSLQDFVQVHARSQLHTGARVWVFSDGFDADPPTELAQVLQALRARSVKVTWFHPTRGVPSSEAIQHARASIDRFIPMATLQDLVVASHQLH